MLYFPEKEIWQSPRDVNLEYEEIYFKTIDECIYYNNSKNKEKGKGYYEKSNCIRNDVRYSNGCH